MRPCRYSVKINRWDIYRVEHVLADSAPRPRNVRSRSSKVAASTSTSMAASIPSKPNQKRTDAFFKVCGRER